MYKNDPFVKYKKFFEVCEKRNSLKASITIYLMLMLVLMLALVCTLVESGRVSAINSRLRSVTYMAAESVFAEYAQPMFDEYGVMFLWSDEERIKEKFNDYIKENLNIDSTGLKQDVSLYGMMPVGSNINSLKYATDENGNIFITQVSEYMKYFMADELVEKILSEINIFDQGDKIKSFMDKIDKYRDVFLSVEKTVSGIKEKIDSAKAMAADPGRLLNEVENLLDEFGLSQENSAAIKVSEKIEELKNAKEQIIRGLNEIKQMTNEYRQKVDKAKEITGTLEQELESEKDSYDDSVYEIVKEEMDEIKAKSGTSETDYYNIDENEAITDSCISQLSQLDYFFSITDKELNSENLSEYKELLDVYKEKLEGFNLDGLGINYENLETGKEKSSFIDEINKLFSGGILQYVAGDVSKKGIETKELPSKTSEKKDANFKKENAAEASVEKVLMSEYVLTHFGNFQNTAKDSALDYEAEYVIGGKDSDRENLEAVLSEIVLIRSGLNLISLLKDPQKKSEALALATAIIGFTGQPVFVEIVKYLIISAWALAESISDAKILFSGDKVSTIKDASEWNISISGLKNFVPSEISGKGNSKGLSYKDYIRILLVFQNRNRQAFRDMDIIQANMCLREHPEFRLKDCISAAEIEADFQANPVFVSLPFVNKYVNASKGAYSFSFIQKYSY